MRGVIWFPIWLGRVWLGRGSLPVAALSVLAAPLVCLCVSTSAFAASTVDTFTFESPEHEVRYRGLIAEIRCPKCQNVNIAGSDAPIAKDLRITVHRLLTDGLSDDEILTFLQDRYGDFVLYDPPLRPNTLLLWLVPLIGFLVIVFVVLRMARRTPQASELSAVDTERLQGLLAKTRTPNPVPNPVQGEHQ